MPSWSRTAGSSSRSRTVRCRSTSNGVDDANYALSLGFRSPQRAVASEAPPMLLGTIRIATFPASDVAFRTHVDAALERLGPCRPPALEQEIRAAYPAAAVRVRTAMAEMWPSVDSETWYAYRDGSVQPQPADEWWLDET